MLAQSGSHGNRPLTTAIGGNYSKGLPRPEAIHRYFDQSQEARHGLCGFPELIKDLQQDMGSVGDVRDTNRASQMKDHLAMVGEGIGALQWLIMEGKPADFVGEVTGGAQMYGNRVLKAYKET